MTPIERAARALAHWTPNVTSWKDVCADPAEADKVHAHYLEQARLVIAAIREPDHDVAVTAFKNGACGAHEDCWRAMIDGVLAKTP